MDYYFFFVGVFLGSFFNVLIDRLPKGQNVLWGRSHCDHCKKTLRWHELIPIISYLLQGGACRRCRKPLSLQYPLIEFATGIVFFFVGGTYFGNMIHMISLLVIFSSFLVITVADSKFQIIPDSMLVVATCGIVALLYGTIPGNLVYVHALSALGAGGFFYALWYFTKGRGMGFGDVKLAFVLGLFLGYPTIVIALYIAFLTGAFLGVILIIVGSKKLKSKIPFGPYLIAGAVISYIAQPYLLSLWSRFF